MSVVLSFIPIAESCVRLTSQNKKTSYKFVFCPESLKKINCTNIKQRFDTGNFSNIIKKGKDHNRLLVFYGYHTVFLI